MIMIIEFKYSVKSHFIETIHLKHNNENNETL